MAPSEGTTSVPTRQAYGFEHILYFRRNALHDKNLKYYQTFTGNLGLDEPSLPDEDKALLHEYVAAVHINARWYNRRVRAEKLLQTVFLIITIALLSLLPIGIYFTPTLIGAEPSNAVNIGARLPVLLAGFYAVHRAMSTWLAQRKLISPYWSARSKLVNEIYTIESDWRSRPKQDQQQRTLVDGFRSAISRGIQEARKIVQEERTNFFTNYTLPDINLPGLLGTAATNAASTIASFESAAVKKLRECQIQVYDRRLDLHAHEVKRRKLQDEKKDAEIRRDAKAPNSRAYTALDAQVNTLAESLSAAEAEEKVAAADLAEADARLGALGALRI